MIFKLDVFLMTDLESRKHGKQKAWDVKGRRQSQSKIRTEQYPVVSVSLGNSNTVTLAISENVFPPVIEASPSQRRFQGCTLASENNFKEPIRNHSSSTVESQTLIKGRNQGGEQGSEIQISRKLSKACNFKAQNEKAKGGKQEMGQDTPKRVCWTRALRDGWDFYQG